MATDWDLVRRVMNSAIDACERLEATGVTENDRAAATRVGDIDVTVWEFLQSSWIMPENYSYMAVRARHDLKEDKPYTPELARVLQGTARFCSELIGAQRLSEPAESVNPFEPGRKKSLRDLASDLETWYTKELVQGVSKALANSRK
jgi:hypothetical protein